MGKVFISLGILVLVGYGYINNIVELVRCDFEPAYKAEVVRSLGLAFPPVGVILGYVTIEDKRSTSQPN